VHSRVRYGSAFVAVLGGSVALMAGGSTQGVSFSSTNTVRATWHRGDAFGPAVAVARGMLHRVAGIALLCSSLLAGCWTQTQTCSPLGCGPVETKPWPSSSSTSSSSYSPADDHSAVIALGALVTGVALMAVLIGRNGSDKPETPKALAQAQPEVKYVLSPAHGDADLRMQRMFVQGHISARAGRCDAVVAIGKKLAVDSPSYHERYVADPTIAPCLAMQTL
jgi:hypothetical protein